MRLLSKIFFISILCIGLVSCEDDQEGIDNAIIGRSWTGDVGMVDEYGEPVLSTFYFGGDGFGKEEQYYFDGVFYDSFRYQWLWEDGYSRNIILEYGRNGTSYMDNVRIVGDELWGTFYFREDSSGFDFKLYMDY